MALFRYLFFLVISLFIHGLVYSLEANTTLAYSVDMSQDRALSIQLIAPVKAQEIKTKAPTKKIKKNEKQKNINKKALRKKVDTAKKPPPKVVKKAAQKVASKVLAVSEKVENVPQKEKLQSIPKELPEPQEEHSEENPNEEGKRADQQIEQQKPVKPAQPKMVKKVTFRAQPTPIKYPHSAKRRNMEGTVLIEVWLNALGQQTKLLIVNSSGHQVLDNAALEAITQWKFSRHQSNGQAIAHRVQIPINFELN